MTPAELACASGIKREELERLKPDDVPRPTEGSTSNLAVLVMSYADIIRILLVGRLTRDPELRALPSGSTVCGLHIACNSVRKDGDVYQSVPTTSTSTSSEPKGRTSSAICAKAPAWPSQAAWNGASRKPPTPTTARPSASSPIPFSSLTRPRAQTAARVRPTARFSRRLGDGWLGVMVALGRRIRQMREEQGMTPAELACAADIDQEYLGALEAGELTPADDLLAVFAADSSATESARKRGVRVNQTRPSAGHRHRLVARARAVARLPLARGDVAERRTARCSTPSGKRGQTD